MILSKIDLFQRSVVSKLLFFGNFILVYGYLLFFIIFPFLKNNNLLTWDSAGLYFSSWYTYNYLFPNVFGWNPYFFLGYPQHQFYSPLYSYLTALLGHLMPLDAAFKLLLVIILIATPLSFYYFARSFSFSPLKASVCMLSMFALLFSFSNAHIGGDFHSTFKIGLITHALGVPLFFFYVGSLERGLARNKFIIPSVLFSLLIIGHIITAVVAGIALLGFILTRLRAKEHAFFIFKHCLLTFLLSAFWVVPFISKFAWSSSAPIGVIAHSFILLLAALIYVTAFYTCSKSIAPIIAFVMTVLVFSIIQSYTLMIPFHFYRVTLYIFLMVPLMALILVKRDALILFIILMLVSSAGILVAPSPEPEGTSQIYHLEPIHSELTGRTLIVAPANAQTSPHVLQQQLPLTNKITSIKGLYVESAKNSPFLLTLEREIDNKSLVWGTYLYPYPENRSEVLEILPYQTNLLNINYIISTENISDWEKMQGITSFYAFDPFDPRLEKYEYSLYKVGNSSLIEVLNYTPRLLDEAEWRHTTSSWFFSKDIKRGIFVNEPVPTNVGNGKETVTMIEMHPSYNSIIFHVNASHPVPILIKISAFPNWQAYENGAPVHIYRASPYLMLIYAHGTIELKYESLWVDKISALLSIAGILYLLILTLNLQSWGTAKKLSSNSEDRFFR